MSALPHSTFVSRHNAQLCQPAGWATLHCSNLLLAAVRRNAVGTYALLGQDASGMRHHSYFAEVDVWAGTPRGRTGASLLTLKS